MLENEFAMCLSDATHDCVKEGEEELGFISKAR